METKSVNTTLKENECNNVTMLFAVTFLSLEIMYYSMCFKQLATWLLCNAKL